jgi:copper homeostasis protein
MLSDIEFAVTNGASGIVCGILNKDNTVDTIRMQQIVVCAGSLGVTFHRAFDMTTDKMKAAEDIIACGCERILTSGGEATAMEGKLMIKQLVSDTSGRIIIMPGSGINHTNYQHLISETGAKEIHLSAKKLIKETQHQGGSNKPILINSDYYLTDKQMISQIQRSFQQ